MNEPVLVQTDGHIGIATLNRPDVLNALSVELMDKLIDHIEAFDRDPDIRVIIIAGSEKVFAAGADIADMSGATFLDMYDRNNLGRWMRIKMVRTPIIAAVSGFALGGGCELAMACDMIVASESAKFGQPEIKLGVMPGLGGTQRLTRAIGKQRAMEMILTGRFMSAKEAYEAGLVTSVASKEQFLAEALRLAGRIAEMPPIAVKLAKESVNKADELSLQEGLAYERTLFYSLFATEDQTEGMQAFIEKRKPEYRGK